MIQRDGRYLVTRRTRGHLAGFWEFPGGKREAGETWQACVRREVQEELGLDVRVGRRLGSVRHEYQDRAVLLAAFRCTIEPNQPAMVEGPSRKWVTPSGLRRLRFPPANKPLLAAVLQRKSPG